MSLPLSAALMICVVACTQCGCGDSYAPAPPTDRSWESGTVSVEPYQDGNERGVNVVGDWTDASPGLTFSFHLGFTQGAGQDYMITRGTRQLDNATFEIPIVNVIYSTGSIHQLDSERPYRIVLDYELWRGEPGSGELLKMDSIYSEELPAPAQ